MMPQNVLSSTVEVGSLLAPRNLRTDLNFLLDYEEGGLAINDATTGLQVQTWTGVCDGQNFTLSSPSDPGGTLVLTVIGTVIDFSFTFDQQMRPFITYTLSDNSAWYWWYDSTIPGYTTTELPAGSLYARCTLDDKRPSQTSASDILLAYTRSGTLYYRQQRDRYGVEYNLVSGLTDSRLINIGLSTVNRMQFDLTPP